MPEAAIVIGTRPEAIKLAPVVAALRAGGVLSPYVVSTGQHRDVLDQALATFGLVPDVDLGVMQPVQSLAGAAARILDATAAVLAERRPSWVVVQGDTTTALAAGLAAFYQRIPVAHVEAGLRSGDPDSPFPEEMNRQLVDRISTMCFAPSEGARALLASEGLTRNVHVTGNTVVDALRWARQRIRRSPPRLEGLDPEALEGRRVVLLTTHRRESFGAPMRSICRAVLRAVRAVPDACVVCPVHPNPAVQSVVRSTLGGEPRVHLVPPAGYLAFVSLLERADVVLTDSGGVQEEAPAFRKPVLVLRDVTERPEGIDAGVARLVGTSEQRIFDETVRWLTDDRARRALRRIANPYGDGRAAQRIARALARHLEERGGQQDQRAA